MINPEKHIGAPLTLGDQTAAIINQFTLHPGKVEVAITRLNTRGSGLDPPMSVALIDSAGTQVWLGSLESDTHALVDLKNTVQPLIFRFIIITRTRDLTLPFEFKDLKLP